MGRKTYTAQDHQRAFEHWYTTRNWSSVAKHLDATWTTTKRWGDADYPCQYGCSWHGYESLMNDRDKAHQARTDLLAKGVVNPVAHEEAMRDAIARKEPGGITVLNPAPLQIVRSDIERMGHWELLWSKVYFHATGVVTTWSNYQGLTQMPEFERLELQEKLRDSLNGGLAATSLEQCVRMLSTIQDKIDGLQGARRRTAAESGPVKDQMTIQDLRKMRKAVLSTPAEKLQRMVEQVNSDEPPNRSAV